MSLFLIHFLNLIFLLGPPQSGAAGAHGANLAEPGPQLGRVFGGAGSEEGRGGVSARGLVFF